VITSTILGYSRRILKVDGCIIGSSSAIGLQDGKAKEKMLIFITIQAALCIFSCCVLRWSIAELTVFEVGPAAF